MQAEEDSWGVEGAHGDGSNGCRLTEIICVDSQLDHDAYVRPWDAQQ